MPTSFLRKSSVFVITMVIVVTYAVIARLYSDRHTELPTINFSNQSSQINVAKGELVAGFPVSIPLYPNRTEIIRSYKTDEVANEMYSVELKTDDPVEEVMIWHRQHLLENNWTIEIEPDQEMTIEKFLKATREDEEIYLTVELTNNRTITEIIIEYKPD